MVMKNLLTGFVASALALTVVPVFAASVNNKDGEAHTLIVTERGERSERVVGAGETLVFCPAGCFITWPNGDRAALTGSESVDIVGGAGVIN